MVDSLRGLRHHVRRRDMILCMLNGSPRKNGNTAKILSLLAAEIGKTLADSVSIERIELSERDIRPCLGCRACFDRGEDFCPLKDDVPVITAALDKANAVVIATPVFMNDVTGTLKTTIDRLAWLSHRPRLAGKPLFVVTTTGVTPSPHTVRTITLAGSTWGLIPSGSLNLVAGAALTAGEEQRFRVETVDFARSILFRLAHSAAAKPSFRSLLVFRVQQEYWQNNTDGSIDYRWWKERRGLLEDGATWYAEHATNPIKTAAARAAGAVIAKFVLK